MRGLRQRPCSTQDTGIFKLVFAGTSIDVLRIRFCLAPVNSSASRNNTILSPLFITDSSGTEPDVLTSLTSMVPFRTATSPSTYSTPEFVSVKSGNTDKASYRRGLPTRMVGMYTDMTPSLLPIGLQLSIQENRTSTNGNEIVTQRHRVT